MQIDFKSEALSQNVLKWNPSPALLVEGDVIVPDIKPDIREILLTEANPVVTAQSSSGGELQITGTVSVHILYLPEGENALPKSMETKFDFKESLTLTEELSDISVRASAGHIEFSLINSRKINVKVAVALSARGYQKGEMTLLTEAPENIPLQVKKKQLNTYQVVADTQREIVITESLEIPAVKPDIDEIIKLDISPVKGDCKIMAEKILLKGSLLVNTLYTAMDTETGMQHIEHEIPFSEMENIDGLDEDCLCNVTYEVKNIYFSVKEDLNGEERIISLDVVLLADITASRTMTLEVIDDCYSTKGETVLTHDRLPLEELLTEGVSHESLKEILTVPADSPAISAVYNLQCTPRIQEMEIVGERLILRGRLAVFVLYGCAEAENSMYSLVNEIAFEHILPVEGIDEAARCEYGVTAQGLSFTLNAASEIELRCVLEFYVRAVRSAEQDLLTGCQLTEEDTPAKHRGMVIYFVQPTDSLWDIAKHYRTSREEIIQLNKLEQTTLLPGQKLLIPGI